MRETRITQGIAVSLVFIAATLIGVKWLVGGITPTRANPDLWHVHVRLGFRSSTKQSGARLYLPRGGDGHAIVHEHFHDDSLKRLQVGSAAARNRAARWRATGTDETHVIDYWAWIDTAPAKNSDQPPSGVTLDKLRAATKMIQADDPLIRSQADAIAAGKEGMDRIRAVVSFVYDTIERGPDTSAVSAVRCLRNRQGGSHSMARLACALLRSQGVPCQLVGGLLLEDDVRTHAFYWVEAWQGQRWVTLAPTAKLAGRRPGHFLPIFRGDYSLARFHDSEDDDLLVTVERKAPPLVVQAAVARNSTNIFKRLSLASLPKDLHNEVGMLLMLPIGALMVACFRNLVGVNTFGIFMPILLSLAFRETHLAWGFAYLALIIGVGVMVRWALNRLRLLMVPRLATMLSVVIALMIGLVFFGSRYGIHSALSVGLFPMVIMTTTVERFFVIQSEDGTVAALKESVTTALVAACGFLLFQWTWLNEVMFTYPELLLVVVALLLLLGRYSGFRLMELRRFRSLAWGSPATN